MDAIRTKVLGGKLTTLEKGESLISDEILRDKPSMIARFGSVEIKGLLYPKSLLLKSFAKERVYKSMYINAGFFPVNNESLEHFSSLMFEEMENLDVLGSWRIEELFLRKKMPRSKLVPLESLEPYYCENPWTKSLEGKKVLVVHPFAETIEKQYAEKRELLFENKDVLPLFKSLETVKAVQTIAGNGDTNFADWFEALDYMKSEIEKKDFEVAIIGCGAYGFPLAAHVKKIGKKAVHMGGATQMLFGIKGKRWQNDPAFNSIINEHFIYPLDADIPANADKVENACYWK